MSSVEDFRTEGPRPAARRPSGASTGKIRRAARHREPGGLATDLRGAAGTPAAGEPYDLTDRQRPFLFSRSGTVHSGPDGAQRDTIAERVLGLPRKARP
ncbi:hypothetical protein GT045_07925 [Streptomyces sp. SID486]|uniref:hypothetical protein n=1 Tax=unclassified Streptomyces TaxID=2593676 RepID=UPI0013716B57|nr:hypothetical protein [Streptomyces sp. SID486]MYX94742.1 hypothetical protein [Streptomyces sp. SID486]